MIKGALFVISWCSKLNSNETAYSTVNRFLDCSSMEIDQYDAGHLSGKNLKINQKRNLSVLDDSNIYQPNLFRCSLHLRKRETSTLDQLNRALNVPIEEKYLTSPLISIPITA